MTAALMVCANMRQVVKNANTLNSWKEIACYLGRGVRTVQRWEAELNLPVHRMGASERSPVFAFRAELDAWLWRQSLVQVQIPAGCPGIGKPEGIDHRTPLGRSAHLTNKTLQLSEKQQAHTRSLMEQIQRMANLLPHITKAV
jgi:hypothetical protein